MESCPQINGHYPFPPGSTFRGFNQTPITQSPVFINNSIHNSRQIHAQNSLPHETDPVGAGRRCSHFRELLDKFSVSKLLLLLASFIGVLLIVIGFGCYIYQFVEFKMALDRISAGHEEILDCFVQFWTLIDFILNLVLVWEIIGLFLVTLITSVVFIAACQSDRMREWNETTRLITKSFSLFFLGLMSCYIQTSMGIVRHSILTKINGWLSCKY